ncbi:MAG: hypothetical protein CMQ45_06760 [Gammaproteobacteria bacterium]|nr:hypothetical protein [Gammaproteobacteria bacterium]
MQGKRGGAGKSVERGLAECFGQSGANLPSRSGRKYAGILTASLINANNLALSRQVVHFNKTHRPK